MLFDLKNEYQIPKFKEYVNKLFSERARNIIFYVFWIGGVVKRSLSLLFDFEFKGGTTIRTYKRTNIFLLPRIFSHLLYSMSLVGNMLHW